MPITLYQLVTGPLPVPENHVLRTVLARDEFGDVRVWNSHEVSWHWVPGGAHLEVSTGAFFDLVVLGHPKVVAAQLATYKTFDRGLFESSISITLAHGLNWVHQWDQGSRSDKAEVLDLLYWMRENAYRWLSYDRYHFSTASIDTLFSTVDEAIIEKDWPAFVLNIKRLYELEAMRFDPHVSSSGLGSR